MLKSSKKAAKKAPVVKKPRVKKMASGKIARVEAIGNTIAVSVGVLA